MQSISGRADLPAAVVIAASLALLHHRATYTNEFNVLADIIGPSEARVQSMSGTAGSLTTAAVAIALAFL